MIVGGHVSASGGLSLALERAHKEGFEAIQIFASPPQSFRPPQHTESQILSFNNLFKKYGFNSLFFHAIYLLNLASPKKDLVSLSVDSLISYMNFGEKVGSVGTIFHIGSYKEMSFDLVSKQLVTLMQKILDNTPDNQYLIIENAAGGGGRIGATLDELVFLHNAVASPRLKFCIDTQHLFATGVDVRDAGEFGGWLSQFDSLIGIKNLVCVHANDSKTEFGSRHDRHENIGQGHIGIDGFESIVRQPMLQNIPFILEVPGDGKKGPNRQNADLLRSLV